jgi:hypothetical protein
MMTVSAITRQLTVITTATFLTACGSYSGTMTAPVDMTLSDVGFSTPESVLHDTVGDVYLVSNINGSPLDKDGNGFISRVSVDGDVLDLNWIDGSNAGTTLNAPKGMAIDGNRLYVADIDCIRMFNRATGAPAGETCVDGASFLNDVTPAIGGGVLFTDTGIDASFSPVGSDAVYRLNSVGIATLIANPELGAPNGIVDTRDGPLVVTFFSGESYHVVGGNRRALTGSSQQQLDGVVVLADGRILMSSWGDSCIYEVTAAGAMTCIIPDVEAPADIGADNRRNRVLIPLFNANTVLIKTVP